MVEKSLSVSPTPRRPRDDDDDELHALSHRPTPTTVAQVEAASQNGVPQRAIAALIGVSVNTLRKHYAPQLVYGNAKVQAAICNTLMRQALGGPAMYDEKGNQTRAEVAPDRILLMFLSKVHCGFRDGGPGQIDPDGKPADDGLEYNTAGLTDGERSGRVLALLNVARARRAGRAIDGASSVVSVSEQPAKPGSEQ